MTAERSYQFTSTAPPYGASYGETFIEQGGHTYDNPYIPTSVGSKELDEETGLYYYGARYYDPKISLWLSVDPLAEKYPGMSPYTYTAGNPVKYIDPDGRDWYQPLGSKDPTNVVWIDGSDEHEGYKHLGYNYYVDEYHFQFLGDTKSSYYVTLSGERKLIMKYENSQISEGIVNNIKTGSSALSTSQGLKNEIIDATVRNNYKSATTWNEFRKLRPTQKAWRYENTLGKTGAKYLKISKRLGAGMAVISTGIEAYQTIDYYANGGSDWRVGGKFLLDAVMTGVSFCGPVGFAIGATYFILDAAGTFDFEPKN